MAGSKLKLLFCVTPIYGHVMPLRAIAKEIIGRGFEVTFITGSVFKKQIEDIGATFIPLGGLADLNDARIAEMNDLALADPSLFPKLTFIDVIPEQFKAFQAGLEHMLEKDPDSRILVITEGLFFGTIPDLLGAPGIHPIGHIAIGVIPMLLSSIDTGPFTSGVLPDSSSDGRERNVRLTEQYQKFLDLPKKTFHDVCRDLGARTTTLFYQDAPYVLFHRFVQMCVPSIEFPRSDAPTTIRFGGGLLPGARDPSSSYPEWWDDVSMNPENKFIVFVSQGTIATDSNDIMIPTMLAFKDDMDFIVVVALGKKGAKLPLGAAIPSNSRVIDFIPYDDILQYSNVFVTNGGYGSIQHGISHGVPLVVGGHGIDKPDNALRIEWAGAGLNLRTHQPDPVRVYEAVVKIRKDSKYRLRAMELQAEMQTYNPVDIIIDNINEVFHERTIST